MENLRKDTEFRKEEFSAYKNLAEFRLMRWQERAKNEWKISISLWTLLFVGSLSLDAKRTALGFELSHCLIIIAIIIVLVLYTFLWVFPIRTRNKSDQESAFYYMEQAEHRLDESVKIRPRPDTLRLGWPWAAWFHIAATALAMIFAGAILW